MIKEIQGIVGQQPPVFVMELSKKVTGKLLFQEACNFPTFIHSMNTQNVSSTVGLPSGTVVKNTPANAGDMGSLLGWEDPMEEEMATHSSILAWKIPCTEEPVGL